MEKQKDLAEDKKVKWSKKKRKKYKMVKIKIIPHQLSANFPRHQLIKTMIIFQNVHIKRCQNILQDLSINIVIDSREAKKFCGIGAY